jgi:GGDEF domain-containing protein
VGEAFCPEDGGDAEQLLTEADRRMYQMKHVHHAQRPARRAGGESLEEPTWSGLTENRRS